MGATREIQVYVGAYADITIPLDRVQRFHETNEQFWGQRTDEGMVGYVEVTYVLREVKRGKKE